MKREAKYILLIIFILALFIRVYFAFSSPEFSSDRTYYIMRQVENIKDTGLPLYNDDLSFGGNKILDFSIYYYILSIFATMFPTALVLKIIPNIFASCLVISVYFLVMKLTKDDKTALFTSFIAAFIPVFVAETANTASPMTLVVPLLFLLFYFFLMIDNDPKYVWHFLIGFIILLLTHPSTIILVIGLIFYLILIKLENIEYKKAEIELILFTILFSLWYFLVVYKNALLLHGTRIVWENIPVQILGKYFVDVSVWDAIGKIGYVPFVYGTFILFRYFFKKEKDKNLFLLAGFAFAVGFLLWFKMIDLTTGFILLGATLVVLFSKHFHFVFTNVYKGRLEKYRTFFFTSYILMFIITSTIPALYFANQTAHQVPSQEDVQALEWIRQNTPKDSKILSTIEEGNMVAFYADRKNVADSNFLLVRNTEQIHDDITFVYTFPYKTTAINIMNQYDADYILLSQKAMQTFNITSLPYEDDMCFLNVYDKGAKIYKSVCVIE